MNAPFAPSRAGTAAEPACQSTSITLLTFRSTALTWMIFPNARPSPARMPETTFTPGTPRSASVARVGNGVKLFVAVSA